MSNTPNMDRIADINRRNLEKLEAQVVTLTADRDRLKEVLAACVAMIEDSMIGLENDQGVFAPGVSDVELRPDGSIMLSDARAALNGSQ